jgi:subtilase family serine protease
MRSLSWISRRWTLAGALILAASVSSSGLPPGAQAVLEFVPLIAEAPDSPADATATNPACTTPAPVRTSAFFHCYTPADIFSAYGVDALHTAGLTGRGETIVIVDSYGSPTALADLQKFSTTFGLPAPDLTIIHPTGTPVFNPAMHAVQVVWAEETSLDLQWAHAIAPDAQLVLIATNPAETEAVQGFPSMFIGEQLAINQFPGSVLSQSFAVTEQSFNAAASTQVAKFDDVYRQAVTNHVTVMGSSGDSGTANVDKQGNTFPFPTVNWPSSDPLVTSAGGTWLQFGWLLDPIAGSPLNFTTGTGRTEAVWNEPAVSAATGGGRSVLFGTPGFQSGISAAVLQGRRGLPDLSWNAAVDGGVLVFTSFPNLRVGWHIIGGTSASSPQLAGVVALANQSRHAQGKASIGYLNPVLYGLSPADFNDIVPHTFGSGASAITLDSNALAGSGIQGMPTTLGWDLTTGFGSPRAPSFVHELAAQP